MAPLITSISRDRDSLNYESSEEDEERVYSTENDGLANMPEEVLQDLSVCFNRLFDPNNFDHLPLEKQAAMFAQRDLTEGRLYQIAKKFFRGSMRPRRRIYTLGGGTKGLSHSVDVIRPSSDEAVPEGRLGHSELNIQVPKVKPVSPRLVVTREKQSQVAEYRDWLSERKKLRYDLDNMGVNLKWLLNKSDRTPLEERMYQEMLEKLRKPKVAAPEIVEKKRKKTPKGDPFIRRPVPRILYVIDKHLRLNKIRLLDFFQRTDKSKTWDISRQEFRTIFETHDLAYKEEELDEMFVCFDKNLSDFIDYRDLAEAMTILQLEKRQLRRTIASGKSISAKDWDSMFSSSPVTTPGAPSRPHTPNQLEVPPSDNRKEQFMLSSDEAMVDLRKRDREALKNNVRLAHTVNLPDEGVAEGGVMSAVDTPAFITPKQDKPPFSTGRGPTRSPQWFPPQSRTAGRNTGSNLRENYPDEEIARPYTNLEKEEPLVPDEELDDQIRPLTPVHSLAAVTKSASSGATRKIVNTSAGRSGHTSPLLSSAKSKPIARLGSRGTRFTNSPCSSKSLRSGKSTRFSKEASNIIKTGVKAIDNHMRPSVLGGETAEMTNKFRRLKLKEYYEIIRLCQQNGIVFNEGLFQRVLLHPGDKVPRELRKIRQPANPLLSAHFADPPERVKTPTIIKQKGKLKQAANGDIFINSRHLYKQRNQCTPAAEKVELSTGRAVVARKIDCWMTYEEYCNLTRQYEERYIKMNGYVNMDAFWPGYMLDKMRLHMPEPDNAGTGKNAIYSHTKQRKPTNPGYFHREVWPESDSGYIKYGDITMDHRKH